MFTETFLLAAVIVCGLCLLTHRRLSEFIRLVKFSKTLKGPKLSEVIRNSRKDLVLPFLADCAKKYGSRFCFFLSTQCFVFITDPEDAKIVLSSQELIYKSNNYSMVAGWLGDGLLLAGGPKWQKARKFLTPAFHFNVLKQFKGAMNDCLDVLVGRLNQFCDGGPVNIYPLMSLYALDVICETALGVTKNAQLSSDSEYVTAVQGICSILHRRSFSLLLRIPLIYRFSHWYREEQRLLKILHGETNNVIRERREAIKGWDVQKMREESSGKYYEGSKRRLAFLDMLLLAQMEGQDISDQQIREEVDTFMFEGHDTTSSALTFALYQLSLHEDCQEKAFEEAMEFEGREQENMPYMEAVIKETLRLYPSVAFYSRSVREDFQLGDLTIPKGASISIQAHSLQRNPEYFTEPDKFRPERFLEDVQQHPFALIAFSAGPRNCIGQKFAMLEMKSTLAGFLRHFKLKEAKEAPKPVLLAELIIKSATGVHVILERRQP